MEEATGEDLEMQRPANSAFAQLPFDNHKDKQNFKMMCMYCHQVGTVGWRTPEEPVDWETMIRRMDGFGGLYKHTQETIVKRIVDTFSDEAVAEWEHVLEKQPHNKQADVYLRMVRAQKDPPSPGSAIKS